MTLEDTKFRKPKPERVALKGPSFPSTGPDDACPAFQLLASVDAGAPGSFEGSIRV